MGNLNQFFRDLGRNAYGLGENVASLGSAAIAEPVAGFAAMYDPANGAQAIREGMTYTPRTQAGQMYQQGAARTLGAIAKPAMPVIDTWQRGVDIAGGYSPMAGAMLRTVPAAIGVAMGAKPALQAGRQVSNSLGAMQSRMIANANAPRTLNAGYMGQRGAIGTQRPLTEFEQAHLLAQQRAALPVNQRGLGLAPDNTAMDRARAMGANTDAYHGGSSDYTKIKKTKATPYGDRFFSTPDPDYASEYAMGGTITGDTAKVKAWREANANGAGPNIMPLLLGEHKASNFAPVEFVSRPWKGNLGEKPQLVRSRFAAFDPFNRDSSNLLAQYGAIAPTATLGALMANEKRKDKRN